VRVAGALLGAALVVAGATGWWALRPHTFDAPSAAAAKPNWSRPVVSAAALPERLGVRLTQVAVTGGGGLVDVRFQVVDPDLAAAIHDPKTPPALVEKGSGLFLDQLLMGHEHSGSFRQAETYFLLFLDSGNWVGRGDQVSVLLGGVQVDDVTVG
jgi:hypothetical protein